MPTSLTFTFEPTQDISFPPYPGRALHALFYQWLGVGDYATAITVHADNGVRPFTVSPLYKQDGRLTLRFTLLDDALWPPLAAGIAKISDIAVLGQSLSLAEGAPEVLPCTYAALAAASSAARRIRLRFCSPTSFRSREMHYPLPDPLLVYQSWLARWNAFAPAAEQINIALLDVVAEHVALGRYDLRTELVDLGKNRKMVGFVGIVQFNVLHAGKVGEAWVRKLNLLADYALYCGTGHKTAQGMGQTRRLSH